MFMANTVFYTMEMRYLLFGNLELTVGEIGPVEVEWLIATVLALFGGYYGADCM